MNRRILALVAILATLALAVWLGFGDGREHEPAKPAEGSAGSAG